MTDTRTLALARAGAISLALDFAVDLARVGGLPLDLNLNLGLDLTSATDLSLIPEVLRGMRADLDALIVKADMLGASVIGGYVQCARNHLDELIKLAEA